jgi:hypothetical protein
MALIDPKVSRCSICNQLLGNEEIFCTTFVGLEHPEFEKLDDAGAHTRCLRRWSERRRFVDVWNMHMFQMRFWDYLTIISNGDLKYAGFVRRLLLRIECRMRAGKVLD